MRWVFDLTVLAVNAFALRETPDMECEEYNELLSAYADRALGIRKTSLVGAHLASCERCRQDLDEIQSVRKMLRALADPEPSPEFWPDVRLNIRAASVSRRRSVSRVIGSAATWGTAAALVMAVIVLSAPKMPGMGTVSPPQTIHCYALISLHASTRAESPFADKGTLLDAIFDSHAADLADDKAFDVD